MKEFRVKNEYVLTAQAQAASKPFDDHERVVTLNETGRAVWGLCNGRRSVGDIAKELADRFDGDVRQIRQDVEQTIAYLAQQNFLEAAEEPFSTASTRLFVVAIEDVPYFHWQIAIFLESFHGKLPQGWRTLVVVCNDGAPLSPDLRRTLDAYRTEIATATNYSKNRSVEIGPGPREYYGALNRIAALAVAATYVGNEDVICLLDSDIFLYREIRPDVLPVGCALPVNWHIEQEKFFASAGGNSDGVDIAKLLEAIGCENEFKPGGVNIFVTGVVAKNEKFIGDCFRFAQVLLLLGRIMGIKLTWMAEMPCFALSLTANGIDYELLRTPELMVSSCDEPEIPVGTFYHYYSDPADFGRAGFHGSDWCKQAYRHENFLRSDCEKFLARVESGSASAHEAYFFELAGAARRRVYMYRTPERLRENEKQAGAIRSLGLGFRKVRIDPAIHKRLLLHFDSRRHLFKSEPANEYLRTENSRAYPSLLDQDEDFNQRLLTDLQPLHEKWSGRSLRKAACYGIRVYQPGSYLLNHIDHVNTHVVSATICVDHDLRAGWPLYIEDFDGRPHEINVDPGEMVFFEGARLIHGRPYSLIGEYYANIFVHYTPLDWNAPSEGR